MARSRRRKTNWDFFLAHASPDKPGARALKRELEAKAKVKVFLDSEEIHAGDGWQERLKKALSESSVSVILISQHTPKAWYQQEEVVLAIDLARDEYAAHEIVPVYLRGARKSDTPYGLSRLQGLREVILGMAGVVDELLKRLGAPRREPTVALAGAVHRVDQIWRRAEPAYAERGITPRKSRRRFVLENNDLVSLDHGHEHQRVTYKQLKKRLSPDALDYIQVLERSMEVNEALWKRAYPRRVVSKKSREEMRLAVQAIANDLESVLQTIKDAGLELDDHYAQMSYILNNPESQ